MFCRQIVPYVGDNKRYTQLLTGLQQGRDYYVHIQVLDRNSYILYTSPDASGRTICAGWANELSYFVLYCGFCRNLKLSVVLTKL